MSNDGSFPQPFEAFSLRVEIIAPVTGLKVTATPSASGDALSMYGLTGEVGLDDIRMDGDHTLTIDALAP